MSPSYVLLEYLAIVLISLHNLDKSLWTFEELRNNSLQSCPTFPKAELLLYSVRCQYVIDTVPGALFLAVGDIEGGGS